MKKRILSKEEHLQKKLLKDTGKVILATSGVIFGIKIFFSILIGIFVGIGKYMDSLSPGIFLVHMFLLCFFIMFIFTIPLISTVFSIKKKLKR